MRRYLGASAVVCALLAPVLTLVVARAQPFTESPISIRLEAPPALVVGARAEVVAHVTVGERAGAPMLLTPSSEGTAVEVVRGRLTRADAEASSGGALRFRVPIVARTAGTAVVRVRIDGFACTVGGRCEALQIEESLVLEVRAARP